MEILAPPFARRGRPGSVYADAGNGRPAPLRLGSRRTPPSPGGLRSAALIVAMTTKTRFLATATWPCFRYPTSISTSSTRDPEARKGGPVSRFASASSSHGCRPRGARFGRRLSLKFSPLVRAGDGGWVSGTWPWWWRYDRRRAVLGRCGGELVAVELAEVVGRHQ
jgi:hypothetical protein